MWLIASSSKILNHCSILDILDCRCKGQESLWGFLVNKPVGLGASLIITMVLLRQRIVASQRRAGISGVMLRGKPELLSPKQEPHFLSNPSAQLRNVSLMSASCLWQASGESLFQGLCNGLQNQYLPAPRDGWRWSWQWLQVVKSWFHGADDPHSLALIRWDYKDSMDREMDSPN